MSTPGRHERRGPATSSGRPSAPSKFHRWLINAFDARLQDDYDAESLVSGERVKEMVDQARIFLAAAQEFLEKEPPEAPAPEEEPPEAPAPEEGASKEEP